MTDQRDAVYAKSGGHCWYCGVSLLGERWHQDHFHPVIRVDGKVLYPELDCFENLVPSCSPCNLYKSSSSIEGYRKNIISQFEQTLNASTGLRQLDRLGLVDIKPKPVVFWYEKQRIQMLPEYHFYGISTMASSVEWKNDEVECCEYASIGNYIVALRPRLDGKSGASVIATDPNWESQVIELSGSKFISERAAEWAIRLNNS